MDNRIFCTFAPTGELDSTVDFLRSTYSILYERVFVLFAEEENEYLLTYNVEMPNLSKFPANTILVHRKKDTNTLYTVNALNRLIESLNGGVLDRTYQVPWQDYRNSVLLIRESKLHKINTKLHKIIGSKV